MKGAKTNNRNNTITLLLELEDNFLFFFCIFDTWLRMFDQFITTVKRNQTVFDKYLAFFV